MSFASGVKDELQQNSHKRLHCQKAELAAIYALNGQLEISSSSGIACSIHTVQAGLARRVYRMIKDHLGINVHLYTKPDRLRRSNRYLVNVQGGHQVDTLLSFLQKGSLQAALIPQSSLLMLQRDCCKQAYLRGAFLAAGSLNDPSSGSYHLEIVTESETHAEDISETLKYFELKAHLIERKSSFIVYLKDRNDIADFLTLVGAMRNRLIFEDVLINRELRNNANRQRNCLVANAERTSAAGFRQQSAIFWLNRDPSIWNSLSPQLMQVAQARLDEPYSTLSDLGESLGISKSAANHRLRKLCSLAEEYGWRGV